ncbi:MAG: helix-turn-helix domain-containing protein [Alphaproteobacteria bacterium]|nr:helix-turn-helix domain-containing protein [Alphaproteobacteria bacterium]
MAKAAKPLTELEGTTALPRAVPRGGPGVAPCGACAVRPLAICAAMPLEHLAQLAAIVTSVSLTAGQPLFLEGEPARHHFIVTGGALKIYKLLSDGRRQVTGFVFPSDFLGLANKETYAYSAEAMTRTELCRFRREKLEAMLDRFPQLERRLLAVANDELAAAQERMLLLGRKTAKERIASFLTTLGRTTSRRGESKQVVTLPMSRTDIGDYLGLSTETVSRTFTELKLAGIVRLEPKSRVRILDDRKINLLAECEDATLGL